MIDGTNLNQLTGSRQLLRAFGGINETYSCSEAELSAGAKRCFPALFCLPGNRRDQIDINVMKSCFSYHLPCSEKFIICMDTSKHFQFSVIDRLKTDT